MKLKDGRERIDDVDMTKVVTGEQIRRSYALGVGSIRYLIIFGNEIL